MAVAAESSAPLEALAFCLRPSKALMASDVLGENTRVSLRDVQGPFGQGGFNGNGGVVHQPSLSGGAVKELVGQLSRDECVVEANSKGY